MSSLEQIRTCGDCIAIRRDREYGGVAYCSWDVSLPIKAEAPPPLVGCRIRDAGGKVMLEIVD
jgi:hypothetical protein